jgi:hypothetical protein
MTKIETISDNCIEEKPSDLFDFFSNKFGVSGTTSFIYNSKAHFIITLYIKEQSGYAHFESICKAIPRKVASRGTVQSILDMGVKLDIFSKLTYQNDKRIKLYNLSEDASDAMDKFFKDFLNALDD